MVAKIDLIPNELTTLLVVEQVSITPITTVCFLVGIIEINPIISPTLDCCPQLELDPNPNQVLNLNQVQLEEVLIEDPVDQDLNLN